MYSANVKRHFLLFALAAVGIALTIGTSPQCVRAGQDVLLDDFEDGDSAGWRVAGDSNYISNYTVLIGKDGANNSKMRLRLTMNGTDGWCGISVPHWLTMPVTNPTAISLDTRGSSGCSGIIIDIFLSDGSRYWGEVSLYNGAWKHIDATPNQFRRVSTTGADLPDFSKITTIWLTLQRIITVTQPAVMDIDNVAMVGDPVAKPTQPTLPSLTAQSCSGATILLADTSTLPSLGQTTGIVPTIETTLRNAGATVTRVTPGSLGTLPAGPNMVLVWEGPVCRNTDWAQVDAYLKRGGALMWWGSSLPFFRPVNDTGIMTVQTRTPAQTLSQGTFQDINPIETSSYWKSTAKGREVWPGFTSDVSILPGKCWYLTTNDSIYLNTHWAWVDFEPLMTIDYTATNWVSLERSFSGSLMSIFRHHSGDYMGARVLLAPVGTSASSPLSPANPMFAHILTGSIRALVQTMTTDSTLDDIPAPAQTITRANLFRHPQKAMGALDFGPAGWTDPNYIYAVNRLGMNIVCPSIPWISEPAADGSVIDWAKADKYVADAEAGGWSVVFDPYPFGYDRFAWATDGGGKTTQAASIYNPIFANKFRESMAALAARYANRPSVVAMFATPDTGTLGFNAVDSTQIGVEAWQAYAAQHGLPTTLPTIPTSGQLDLSPSRTAYIEFWAENDLAFMRGVINAIRAAVPDMPLLLRGPYLDVALSFRLASEYKDVAPYCECQETSIDVESYLRGFGGRYGVPIAGENGWPKERGSALRMANATTLLGGYRAYLFSFGGALWARPGVYEFDTLSRVWPYLRGAGYPTAKAGLLIPDSKIWASNPANFFSAGGSSVEYLMERSGIPFDAVSCQWPKLDGLSVLIDDGRCEVLRASSRQAIVDWVRAGGTLIVFPTTGRYDAAGGSTSLASALGVTFNSGQKIVGNGKVVVFTSVPTDENHSLAGQFLAAINQGGAPTPISVTPYVNQAILIKGNKTYLVLYNKSNTLVGSFFTESWIPGAEAAMPNQTLTVSVPAGTTAVRELVTGADLTVVNGQISVALPGTQWRVVEFTGAPLTTLSTAKTLSSGASVLCSGVVTSVIPDLSFFYMESPDRTSGIRVHSYIGMPKVGRQVRVTGQVNSLSAGEKYIVADSIEEAAGDPVAPLGMQNKSLGGNAVTGGAGMDNIGLLVKVWGHVHSSGGRYTISDGSGVETNVQLFNGSITDGSFASITGISSCELIDGDVTRLLIVDSSDNVSEVQ